MVETVWRRLAARRLLLALALTGLVVTQREGVAQSGKCGFGKGPLCQEIESCEQLAFGERCTTKLTYYMVDMT